MVIDKEGKIFDERRKVERRVQNVKVQTDRRVSDRRNESNANKK